jgi:hypothetical protein
VHCLALLPLYLLASVCFGCALTPSIYFFHKTENLLFVGLRLGIGYFIFGFSLILIVPFFNFILRANLKPWKGPYYSLASVRWYIHNGLTYLVRYTFLSFLTPTPFGILFFKLMGMKIGKGTQINSENISNPLINNDSSR